MMKMVLRYLALTVLASVVVLGGCSLFGDTGTIQLSVTDAPIVDDDSVTGVYVTFEGVEYNRNGTWEPMSGFDGPKTFDLLALTGGESELLGTLNLPSGTYSQIRFLVAAEDEGSAVPTNTGTWISRDSNDTYDSSVDAPLFVPSGAQSGYKAISGRPFDVPANGTVAITADFDLRRAVVSAGGFYILKPVIRLVVQDQAGTITGDVTNNSGNNLVVYAYEDGEFSASEADAASDGSRFPNAVTSFAVADTDGDSTLDYTLAFLAAGTYDLVIAQYDPTTGDYEPGTGDAIDYEDVEVTAGETTTRDLTE